MYSFMYIRKTKNWEHTQRERERERGTYNKVMVMDFGLSQGKEHPIEKQKLKKQ